MASPDTEAGSSGRVYSMRSGERHIIIVPRAARRTFRNTATTAYPASYGRKSIISRGPMGKAVTDALDARTAFDGATPATARIVKGTSSHTTAMASNNVSRNHILADSRIRVILDDILHRYSKGNLDLQQLKAVERFIEAITGESGEEQFEKLCNAFSKGPVETKVVYDRIANGILNLRMGLASFNTVISNLFDPVLIDGQLDERSTAIRDAVINLGWHGIIDVTLQMDSLAMARDRETGLSLASSSMSSLDPMQVHGLTMVDSFIQRQSRPVRSNSISFLLREHGPAAAAGQQMWHHTARELSAHAYYEDEDVSDEAAAPLWDPSVIQAAPPVLGRGQIEEERAGADEAPMRQALDLNEGQSRVADVISEEDPSMARALEPIAAPAPAVEGAADPPMGQALDPALGNPEPLAAGGDEIPMGEALNPQAAGADPMEVDGGMPEGEILISETSAEEPMAAAIAG